ncbi:MAG: GNAT family N-acetyltransferase [Methylococcaceae bacterium]|jgi:N-acetylglutamate synthase-like GNAT family acetyltransferase
MKIQNYSIEYADFASAFEAINKLRSTVLTPEYTIEDTLDWQCHHVIARDDEQQVLGGGCLSPDGEISYLAVLPPYHNMGIGRGLLDALSNKARKLNHHEMWLKAPVSVQDYFLKHGFYQTGEDILKLTLTPKPIVRNTVKPRQTSVPAEEINTLADAGIASAQLITGGRRGLGIFTPDLELNLYGQKQVLSALKQFAIENREGQIRIIVQNTMNARSQKHPLLDLAQRLPSSFLFREPVEAEELQYTSAYLINDRDGYLFRVANNRYQGSWSPALASRQRQLRDEFERAWERCLPCVEFRTLGL